MAEIVAVFIVGLVVGALVGVGMTWDRRFNEGRRYGYEQGRERADDLDSLDRIRRLM